MVAVPPSTIGPSAPVRVAKPVSLMVSLSLAPANASRNDPGPAGEGCFGLG